MKHSPHHIKHEQRKAIRQAQKGGCREEKRENLSHKAFCKNNFSERVTSQTKVPRFRFFKKKRP